MTRANEEYLKSFAEVISEGDSDERVGDSALIERLEGCTAILSLNGYGASDISPDVLRAVGTVRFICKAHHWGQFDHLPRTLHVEVVEGSNLGTVAVAEWCLTAALMGARQLQEFNERLKAGSPWGEPRRGVGMLRGSVVGVVGLGRIGRYFAQSCRALGMTVIAHSRSWSSQQAEAFGVQLVALDELLVSADVISLHHEVVDSTRARLTEREFALIRSGAVFINSARAALYDEEALIRELATGRFVAYLDVFAVEPLPLDHPFRSLPNVTLTPHIAGNNSAMFSGCARDAIQTLEEYFKHGRANDRRYTFP